MKMINITALLGLLVGAVCVHAIPEVNTWPGPVSQLDAEGNAISWNGLGPFLFSKPDPEGGTVHGFRPFYVERTKSDGGVRNLSIFYPLFYYRNYDDSKVWSLFELINRTEKRPNVPNSDFVDNTLDIWPFYFSRDSKDPAETYHAVFPLYGTTYDFLTYPRMSWVLWPIYFQTEKRGTVSTYYVFPFIRHVTGRTQGGGLWPVYGHTHGPGEAYHTFAVWPIYTHNFIPPPEDAEAGAQPTEQFSLFPLYTSEKSTGSVNKTYVWPFFGYSDRTVPEQYHETRYFWPFFVQGEGVKKTVSRYAPFYTHSWSAKSEERTWVMWPLWKDERWNEDNIGQHKQSLFYFIYLYQHQQSLSNPNAAPAFKRHIWPFFSKWDNGQGRVQEQVLSPFEPFFPDNEKVREGWAPLAAVYRYNHSPDGSTRTSVLWDALDWSHDAKQEQRAFHLGPLFGVEESNEAKRFSIGNGLFGWRRDNATGHWSTFWLDFPSKRARINTLDKP